MGKKHIYKNPYTGDITVEDYEKGEKETWIKYGSAFTEGYVSNKGNKISWDNNLFDNKDQQTERKSNTYNYLNDAQNPWYSESVNISSNGHGYYDPNSLPKYPSRKNLYIYIGIMAYFILAAMIKALPRPDMLCQYILIIGFLQYALAAGLDRDVDFREYFYIGGGWWILQIVCHVLIFAYPRDSAYYTDSFWSAGFKYACFAYGVGMVLFIFGKIIKRFKQ